MKCCVPVDFRFWPPEGSRITHTKKTCFHVIWTVTTAFQERIAKAHGSQCGFCTPGIVMSMYALLRNNPTPKMADVEEAFHGTAGDRTVHRGEKMCTPRIRNYRDDTDFFFFCSRKFVPLHRIQTHPGGIQDVHRGETRHTAIRKSDMFICKLKNQVIECLQVLKVNVLVQYITWNSFPVIYPSGLFVTLFLQYNSTG